MSKKQKHQNNTVDLKAWQPVLRKINDLLPYERNPRTITEERFNKLKQRIQSQGYRSPICIDHDGTILAGHQRFRAMIDLGFGDAEIYVMLPPKDLVITNELKREIIVSDNISWGEFDYDILTADNEMQELEEWGMYDIPEPPEEESEEEQQQSEAENLTEVTCPHCKHEFSVDSEGNTRS